MATVKEIQLLLKANGYDISADGLPGPKTTAAIKDFQRRMGLTIDGDVGANTLAALQKGAIPITPIVNPIIPITDQVTVDRIAKLHPSVRAEVTRLIQQANAQLTVHSQVRIVQGFRTFEEQAALYAQGRTTPGPIVTNAKAGQSIHNYGVAIDFALLIDGKEISWDLQKDWDGDKIADWMEVVRVFTQAGWQWGGTWHFQDNPHLEKLHDYAPLLAKYNKGDFISGTKYVNL